MSAAFRTSGSIRRRLILQLVGSAALLAAVLFVLVQSFARQVAAESQDSILTASVTSILESASVQLGEVSIDIPYAALSMLSTISDERVFYRIDIDGQPLTGYDDLPIPQPVSDPSSPPVFETTTYKGDSIRVVSTSRRLSLDGRPVTVTAAVAQTRDGQALVLSSISRTAALFGVGFFLLSAVIAVLAARSSVRPLQDLASAVARRGPQDLRPVSSPVPTEMAPLVSSLNRFIGRLGTSLGRSEEFIAEAAHRVRTPLATVRTQAEIALRRVERPENRSSLKEMIRAIDESSRAAGQLLDHAMVTFRTDHLEREQIDLSLLTAETVDRLRPIAEFKDITLNLRTDGAATVKGDPILIQNALANIIDNAIKYSPPDTEITVDVALADDRPQVTIADQGPGFPADDTTDLTQRFARGDNVSGTVGSGLGLTIAKDVVEAHGGTLTLNTSKTGTGACVTLSFPG